MKAIYTFGNGQAEGRADMRDLLGGKGANLAEMNLIGVPVPPGFTITTEVCRLYNEQGREAVVAMIKEDVKKFRSDYTTMHYCFDDKEFLDTLEGFAGKIGF